MERNKFLFLLLTGVPAALLACNTKAGAVRPTDEQPGASPQKSTTTKRANQLEWGMFTGKLETAKEIEARVGRQMNYTTTFTAWADGVTIPPEVRIYAEKNEKTIILFSEAYTPGIPAADDVEFSCRRILDGVHDNYLGILQRDLSTIQTHVLFAPFHEGNKEWIPQSELIKSNKGLFRRTFDYVIEKVAKGNRNVIPTLVLNIQDPDDPANPMKNYNAAKAQRIGLDGFNFGPPQEEWLSFGQLFKPSLDEVKNWGKPLILSSIASAPGEKQADWWREVFEVTKSGRYNINGINIFGENKAGQGDWERNWMPDDKSMEVIRTSLG